MFTSRAEHRLLLRQDNADRRLLEYGARLGLIPDETLSEMKNREALINKNMDFLREFKLHAKVVNPYLEKLNTDPIESTETIAKLCKRPELKLQEILELVEEEKRNGIGELLNNPAALEQVEIELKYEGYIKRQQELVEKLERYEEMQIPLNFNYLQIKSLSSEGREKLSRVKPRSIGQASRISGVTPSDISILLVYLRH